MYEDTGEVEDRDFPITIGFFGEPDTWTDKYRAIKKWLQSPLPENLPFRTLQFTDDTCYYYKVKKIVLETTEREAKDLGQAVVKFTIDGYDFKREGFARVPFNYDEFYNIDNQKWQPIIEFNVDEIERDGEIIITAGRLNNDNDLIAEKTLIINVTSSEGASKFFLDLSLPVAVVYTTENGETTEKSAFSKLQGDFETLLGDYSIVWETRGGVSSDDVTATIRPLYKER